mgnify:CR=1 FL=1
MVRARGGDAEAAVAHHHRGHAVPGRDREHPIPHHLRVVVGMDVDEAGRDHEPVGVDRLCGGAFRLAERGDAAAPDPDVATHAWPSRAVDHGAAPDDEIEVHRSGAREAVELGHVVVEDQAQLGRGQMGGVLGEELL